MKKDQFSNAAGLRQEPLSGNLPHILAAARTHARTRTSIHNSPLRPPFQASPPSHPLFLSPLSPCLHLLLPEPALLSSPRARLWSRRCRQRPGEERHPGTEEREMGGGKGTPGSRLHSVREWRATTHASPTIHHYSRCLGRVTGSCSLSRATAGQETRTAGGKAGDNASPHPLYRPPQ